MQQFPYLKIKIPPGLLALYFFCTAAGSLYAQDYPGRRPITIKGENIRLADLFNAVWDQIHMQAFYNDEQLSSDEKVNVNFKREPLDNVLAFLLRKKGLTWYYREETFVILPKKPGEPDRGQMPDEAMISVPGVVTNTNGVPLQNASVVVKGGHEGDYTDDEGLFFIPRVQKKNTITISCIGYTSKHIKVLDDDTLLVRLAPAITKLDEVMILAYGTSSRRYLTASVSKVSSRDIERQPVSDPLLALQGRMPGLAVTQRTGLPGGEIKLELRGRNSIAAGNSPLYIIDGIPFPSTALTYNTLQNVNSISPLMASNPLNLINISDIESMEVLKDADATAIYGSRAANGIILITTKKPAAGPMKLEAALYSGIERMAHPKDYLGTGQYLSMRKEAFLRDGATPHNSDYDLLRWDSTRSTDWENAMLGGTARVTDAQLALNAGNNNVQLRVSGGCRREGTVYPGAFVYQKAAGRVTLRVYSPDRKTSLYLTTAYAGDRNYLPPMDLSFYTATAPNAPEAYTAGGLLNWDEGNFDNPYSAVKRYYIGTNSDLMSQLVLSRDLASGLQLKASLGYNGMSAEEKQPNAFRWLNPAYGYGSTLGGYAYFASSKMKSWIAEPQLLYNHKWGKLTFGGLLGLTFQQDNREQQGYLGSGFSSDASAQLENMTAAGTLSPQGSYDYRYRYNAVFGQLNLRYREKYILNLTGRRDGSSRFGPGNRFANFGAVGAAWIFSEEPLVRHALPWLSFGKLRTSYGVTGNDQIRDYGYLSTYMPALLYGEQRGQWPTRLFNPNYGWEQNRKGEIGLELGFMEERLLLRGTYYRNLAGNQLVRYPLSSVTGFGDIQDNINATVSNTGWELELSAGVLKENNLSWTTGLNFSWPRNVLQAFPGLESSVYRNYYTIGFPLNIKKGYRYEGIDPASGLYRFTDANKDGKLDASDYIANKQTGIICFGGWQHSLRYKGWSLDLLLQYVKQNAYNDLLSSVAPGYGMANQPAAVWDRWTGAGSQGRVQRFTQEPGEASLAYYYAQLSDLSVTDASYLRLKNLSLSYSLPDALMQRWKLQYVRLFMQGQNIFTLTPYRGRDPEVATDTNVYPPLRIWTMGMRMGL